MFKLIFSIFLFTFFAFANSVSVDFKNNFSPIVLKAENNIFDMNSSYTSKELIKCQPRLKALYKVVSENELKILPNAILKSGTKYSCSYKDVNFTFQTNPLKIISTKLFKKEKLLRVALNDYIDKKSLQEHLELYKIDRLTDTKLKYKIGNIDKNIALIKIIEPIRNFDIKILLKSGYKSKRGSILKNDIEQIIKNRKNSFILDHSKESLTFNDKPKMISKEGKLVIRVFFRGSIENLENFIEIDGVKNFKISKVKYIPCCDSNFKNIGSDYYVDISSSEFKPNHKYKIILKKGLSLYFYQLKKDISFIVNSKDIEPYIGFYDSNKHYLTNLGNIGFKSINLNIATLRVSKVHIDNFRYFVIFNKANIDNVEEYTKEIFNKDIVLDNPKNKLVKQKIHIQDLTGTDSGVYKISFNYSYNKNEFENSKVVFLSDIAINAKIAKNQAFVYLTSLKNNTPIANADITILSNKNIIIARVKSDENGVAIVNKKDLIYKKPMAIIVQKGKDRNFLLFNHPLNNIALDDLLKDSSKYRAYIKFQSDIIRPNSTLKALIVLKDNNLISAKKLPVKIELHSLIDDKSVDKKEYITDDYGVIDYKIPILYYQKTGPYKLNVYLGKKKIASKRVDIESFVPPQIENKIESKNECYANNYLDVTVSSQYLFGAVAANLEGKVTLKAYQATYRDSRFKNYSFDNIDDNYISFINYSKDIKLDKNGKAKLLVPCAIDDDKKPQYLKAILGVTIFDGVQPVAKYKDIKIYPYSKLVGIWISNDILDINKKMRVKAIIIDAKSKKVLDGDLIIKVRKSFWRFDYEDGSINWSKESKEIDSFVVKANQEFEYSFNDDGYYEFEVIDPISDASAKKEFEVNAWGYSTLAKGGNAKSVDIDFKDKFYKRGDILKASIKSPIIKGRLLLTIEDNKVLWHKFYNINKGSALIDIPLDFNLSKGLELNAIVTRVTDANESIIPFRAYGYKDIKADRFDKKLKISLDFNHTIKSKSNFNLKIKSNKEAEFVVSIVDKAILNMTNQKIPDPFKYFTPHPGVVIPYFDIYDNVLGFLIEGKLISFGADAASLANRKKHLPSPNSDKVKPFMLWSGIVKSKNKEANLTFKIPDFNGKARVDVVAVNTDSIGAKSDYLTIKDPISISISMPRFLLEGDNLKTRVKVFNNTKSDKNIILTLLSSKSLQIDLNKTKFELKPNSSKSLILNIKAKKISKAYIKAIAKSGKDSYKKDIKIDINTPYTLSSFIESGITGKDLNITIPKDYVAGSVIINLSNNIFDMLNSDLRYLIYYPYGCAEQTASQIGAMFWAKDYINDKNITKKAEGFIKGGISKLISMMNREGEIRYWIDTKEVNPYASVYATDVLLDIDANSKYKLKSEDRNRLIDALIKVITDQDYLTQSYNEFLVSYSAYILAKNKALSPYILNMIYQKGKYKKDKFAALYIAAAFYESGNRELSKEIYKSLNVSLDDILKEDNYYSWFNIYGSTEWNLLTYAYLKAKYFGLNDSEFAIVRNSFKNRLYSTQDKALAFRFLNAYIGKIKKGDMRVKLTINKKSKIYSKATILTKKLLISNIKIEPIKGAIIYSIDVYKYLPKAIKNSLDYSKNLTIKRDFISKSGYKLNLNNLIYRKEIYAKVTIVNGKKIDNVMIDMRLPSCLEIINSRIEKGFKNDFKNENIKFDYMDIRDDRVLFATSLNEKKVTTFINGEWGEKILPNKHIFYIPLRVTALGKCRLPSINIEAMYNPNLRDYAKEANYIIVKKSGDDKAKNIKDKIKDFVKNYYLTEESSNIISENAKYFTFPIKKFFGKKDYSYNQFVMNREDYFKNFPQREYKIKNIDINMIDTKHYRVKIDFDYILKNAKKEIKGLSTQYLIILVKKDNFSIEEIGIK